MFHSHLRLALLGAVVSTLCACGSSSSIDGGGAGGGRAGGGTGTAGGGTGAAGGGTGGLGGGTGAMGGGTGAVGGGTGTGGGSTSADGGMLAKGDRCSNPIPLQFDGGLVARATADLTTAGDDYAPTCSPAARAGSDLVYSFTLTQPTAVAVTATPADGGDPILSVRTEPCETSPSVLCVDLGGNTEPETLSDPRLAAGTYYVVVDAYSAVSSSAVELTVTLSQATPPPPNDGCSGAIPLTFTNNVAVASGSTAAASNSNPAGATTPVCDPLARTGKDVVYSFTLTQPQDVVVQAAATATSDLIAVAYLRNVCADDTRAAELACDAEGNGVTRYGLPAGTYFVWVDSEVGTSGDFELQVSLETASTLPANDTCSSPEPVALSGTTASITASLIGANDDETGGCADGSNGADLLYSFTLTVPQKVRIVSTPDTDGDPVLVLRGATCGGSDLACVDRRGSAGAEVLVANLQAGNHHLVLDAYSPGNSTQQTVAIDLLPPAVAPSNDTCATAKPVTLTAGTATEVVDLTAAAADSTSTTCPAVGRDAVFSVEVPPGKALTVSATSPGFAADVVLYARSTCAGPELDCIDDVGSTTAEDLVLTNTGATPATYLVFVDSYYVSDADTVSVTFTTN